MPLCGGCIYILNDEHLSFMNKLFVVIKCYIYILVLVFFTLTQI